LPGAIPKGMHDDAPSWGTSSDAHPLQSLWHPSASDTPSPKADVTSLWGASHGELAFRFCRISCMGNRPCRAAQLPALCLPAFRCARPADKGLSLEQPNMVWNLPTTQAERSNCIWRGALLAPRQDQIAGHPIGTTRSVTPSGIQLDKGKAESGSISHPTSHSDHPHEDLRALCPGMHEKPMLTFPGSQRSCLLLAETTTSSPTLHPWDMPAFTTNFRRYRPERRHRA